MLKEDGQYKTIRTKDGGHGIWSVRQHWKYICTWSYQFGDIPTNQRCYCRPTHIPRTVPRGAEFDKCLFQATHPCFGHCMAYCPSSSPGSYPIPVFPRCSQSFVFRQMGSQTLHLQAKLLGNCHIFMLYILLVSLGISLNTLTLHINIKKKTCNFILLSNCFDKSTWKCHRTVAQIAIFSPPQTL